MNMEDCKQRDKTRGVTWYMQRDDTIFINLGNLRYVCGESVTLSLLSQINGTVCTSFNSSWDNVG